jgi:hypothetical protein
MATCKRFKTVRSAALGKNVKRCAAFTRTRTGLSGGGTGPYWVGALVKGEPNWAKFNKVKGGDFTEDVNDAGDNVITYWAASRSAATKILDALKKFNSRVFMEETDFYP